MDVPNVEKEQPTEPLDRRSGWKIWDLEKKIYRWWMGNQWADTYQRIEKDNDQVADHV